MPTNDLLLSLKEFERSSPFTAFLGINDSNNKVDVQGNFYLARMPGLSKNENSLSNSDAKSLKYFIFKKTRGKIRPVKFKEFINSGVLPHLLDDAKNLYNKVFGNDKIVGAVKVVCDDNVAIFGGKEVLTFSLPSEDDRSTQKEYANNISIKNRKRGAKHNDSRSL